MDAKLKSSFWGDQDVLECDTQMKLAAIWSFSNPRIDILGMTQVSVKMFEFETGAPYKVLARTLEALPGVISLHGNTLWAHKYTRFQFGYGRRLLSSNCFRAICARLESVQNEDLVRAFLGAYKELGAVWPNWRDSVPKRGRIEKGLPTPLQGGNSTSTSTSTLGESAERGEIPSPKEWMEGCAMAGLPADFAMAEWHKLGETGFQVRNGVFLTRANMHHAIARRVGWWREQRLNPRRDSRVDRPALQAELENLRSAGDPATLERRKELVRLLEGGA